MRCFYIALLFAVSHCRVGHKNKVSIDITAPFLKGVRTTELGIEATWSEVAGPPGDPVLGYKLKVWMPDKKPAYRYKWVNGKKVLVTDLAEQELHPLGKPPSSKPILVQDVKGTKAFLDIIEPNVNYEIRVLAYTQSNESPMSNAIRVFLQSNTTEVNKSGMLLS